MKLVVTHPVGNQNVRAALKGFIDAGISTSFETTIATFPGGILNLLGSVKPFSVLNRRCFDRSVEKGASLWPWLEMGRLIAMRTGLQRLTRHEHGFFCVDAVYKSLDKHVAKKLDRSRGNASVYGYEDGSLHTFRAAKKCGATCFYDLPIGYWRAGQKIFEDQRNLWPEWGTTIPGLKNSLSKLMAKDEELTLADRIYVASRYTASTLQEYPGKLAKIEIIPYGFPPIALTRTYAPLINRRLRILFVGGLSQRKGIANLFAAVKRLKRFVSLTLVGPKPMEECAALEKELLHHTYMNSVSHDDVLRLMHDHDVLVFPSLFEGFGLVITEAMSQGTPVITTERTAGPDLIENGTDGWIIEAGSVDAIYHALANILTTPNQIRTVGEAARQRAQKRPWEIYGRELAESVMR